jgi:hypothetical protein
MPRQSGRAQACRHCLNIGEQRHTLSGEQRRTAALPTKKRQDLQLGTILQHSFRSMSGLT